MRKFIFVLFLFNAIASFGQESISIKDAKIIGSTEFPVGFYLSHEDFAKNKPDQMGVPFSEGTKFVWRRSWLNNSRQKLRVYNKAGKKVKIKFKFWGYNDGKNMYVYYKKRFCQFELIGRYSVFNRSFKDDYYSTSGHTYTYSRDDDYVLDILTGEVFKLNNRNVRKYLLKDYPDLLKDFNENEIKKMMYYTYVNQVNKKFENKK